jgi:leucyl/phenylalanyl-tRNA--protein transferase
MAANHPEDCAAPDQVALTPQLLIAAYSQGLFPMAAGRQSDNVQWFSPDQRAILPLDAVRIPRSIRRHLRRQTFDIRMDTAFEQVIQGCAQPRAREEETWINQQIIGAYTELHYLGLAHSVEAWRGGRLVGGLYGVALRGAFFGESMFHDAAAGGTDASKVCLVHLVDHLNRRGYRLLDTQIANPHMEQFGMIEIPRSAYLRRLRRALELDVSWFD